MPDAAQLVQNVRRSLAGTYDVLGYVGPDANGAQILLGRELSGDTLVAVSIAADDAAQRSPEIQHSLRKTVMVAGSVCPECRTPLPELDAFCFHCGANLSGSIAAPGTPDSELVLHALATATAGKYEILGRLDREGNTGAVYFARDVGTDQIAALRLKRVDSSEAVRPEYVQNLIDVFGTREIQAQAARQKTQELENARIAAERVAAERVAAERVAAERAAAERAADERANAERLAAERAEAERAANAAQVVAERAAIEHAKAERAASERAATERMVAERAAAELAAAGSAAAAAYMPPSIADFSIPQESDFTSTLSQLDTHAEPASIADTDNSAATTTKKSGSMRRPLLAGGVIALVAVLGFFAFNRANNAPAIVTALPSADSVKQSAVAPLPPVDTAKADTASTSATATPGAAAVPATSVNATTTVADSGTIRVSTIPADARITVDGKGVRGRVLRVSARSHQLAVTAKGFEPYMEKLTVAAGATVRWAPKLAAVVAAAAPTTSAPAAAAPVTTANTNNKKSCRELVRTEDWSSAHETCTTEANTGNNAAAASLGRMYSQGLGVTRDDAASAKWYRTAATGGDHEAQSFMGYALRDGKGVKRDDKESAQMFKLAAEGGDKAAQLEYGVALEKGDGVKKDQAAARDWYKKAADQGISIAARRLGRMYEKGDGGPKSEPDAITAYERAATLGDAESAMTVGKWYRDGKGVSPSPALALTWFKKALELGNKDAQNEIKKLQK